MRPYLLSYQQQALWLLAQLIPVAQQCALNLCYALRLCGSMNSAAMNNALRSLVSRHPVLGLRVFVTGGEVWQVNGGPGQVEFKTIDLRDRPDAYAVAAASAAREAQTTVSVTESPLARFTLIIVGPQEQWLIINVHHLVADGLSIGILRRDLSVLYSSEVTGNAVDLPPLAVGYERFVADQLVELQNLREQEEYWTGQLSPDLEALDMKPDYPRSGTRSFSGGSVSVPLDRALLDKYREEGVRLQAPLSAFLLAPFALLLHRGTGARRIIMGTSFAGRRQNMAWRDAVGLFTNTVPLQSSLSKGTTWPEWVRYIRDQYFAAYDHQAYPLQLLLRKVALPRDQRRPVLFQVAYNFQTLPPEPANWAGLVEVSFERIETPTCILELALHISVGAGSATGRFDYCADLFSHEKISNMARNYLAMLEQVVAGGDPICERV